MINEIENGTRKDFREEDNAHNLVGVLKDYLRQLPISVIPFAERDKWEGTNYKPQAVEKLRSLALQLKRSHEHLLRHLICLLYKICKEEKSEMTYESIGIAIAPSLSCLKDTRSPGAVESMQRIYAWNHTVKTLIERCSEIFGPGVTSLLDTDETDCRGDETHTPSTVFKYYNNNYFGIQLNCSPVNSAETNELVKRESSFKKQTNRKIKRRLRFNGSAARWKSAPETKTIELLQKTIKVSIKNHISGKFSSDNCLPKDGVIIQECLKSPRSLNGLLEAEITNANAKREFF